MDEKQLYLKWCKMMGTNKHGTHRHGNSNWGNGGGGGGMGGGGGAQACAVPFSPFSFSMITLI